MGFGTVGTNTMPPADENEKEAAKRQLYAEEEEKELAIE